jgi:hypothetical protein
MISEQSLPRQLPFATYQFSLLEISMKLWLEIWLGIWLETLP